MRRALILVSFVVIAISACSSDRWDSTESIADVRAPHILWLHAPAGKSKIVGLEVHVTGTIQGDADISLMLNGAPYRPEHLSGAVSFDWGGDWYSTEAEVRYTPQLVSEGKLSLRVRFREL